MKFKSIAAAATLLAGSIVLIGLRLPDISGLLGDLRRVFVADAPTL